MELETCFVAIIFCYVPERACLFIFFNVCMLEVYYLIFNVISYLMGLTVMKLSASQQNLYPYVYL